MMIIAPGLRYADIADLPYPVWKTLKTRVDERRN